MLRGVRIRTLAAVLALTLSACGQADAPSSDTMAPAPASEQSPGAVATDPNAEFCAEVGRRVSAADCADLSALADQAQQGVAAFNAPNPMQRGDVHTLQLAISFAPTPEQIAAREAALAEAARAAQVARAQAEREERLAEERSPQVSGCRRVAIRSIRGSNPVEIFDLRGTALRTAPPSELGNPTSAVECAGSPAFLMIEVNGERALIRRTRVRLAVEQPTLPSCETTSGSACGSFASQDSRNASSTGVAPRPVDVTPEDVVDPLQGETETFTPLVGRFMRAELTGNGFEITPLTDASQEVMRDSVTTWSWRVVAREGGRRSVTLRTVVEGCTAEGQCYPLRSTSQNYDVTVEVGPMGQVQDFLTAAPVWLRLLAGVLAALAVLVGAWFGLRNAFRKGRAGA
jgi:hypothetical protein